MSKKEFNFAKKIVKQAYHKIIKNHVVEVSRKNDLSLVTNIDVATENFLVQKILKKYPNDTLHTEEKNSKSKIESRTWIIDPIDGTTNFSNGGDMWSIQLAFVVDGAVQFSIMYFPKLRRFYTAFEKDVKLNNKKLTLHECNNMGMIVHYIGSVKKNVEDLRDCYSALKSVAQSQLYCGCASFAYAEIISGNCAAVITYNLKNVWDYLPGEFMFQLLGFTKKEYKNYKNGTLVLYSRSRDIVNTLDLLIQK